MAGGGFDLVITDIQMPGGLSGNDLARSIRDSKERQVPIIAMSGRPDAVAAGLFDIFLNKPFSPGILAGLIPVLLHRLRQGPGNHSRYQADFHETK